MKIFLFSILFIVQMYQNDEVTLTFIDAPLVADDEITYYFKKGDANENCFNPYI